MSVSVGNGSTLNIHRPVARVADDNITPCIIQSAAIRDCHRSTGIFEKGNGGNITHGAALNVNCTYARITNSSTAGIPCATSYGYCAGGSRTRAKVATPVECHQAAIDVQRALAGPAHRDSATISSPCAAVNGHRSIGGAAIAKNGHTPQCAAVED